MALFLVQHGKSLPKEKDPDRGLSRQGIEETRAMAGVAQKQNVQVLRIIHSGKKRALQTAEIFMKTLEPEDGIAKSPGLAPLDDVTVFAAKISAEENIMVVGHLPFMERMASYLVTGSIDTPLFRFQNSGIVCLDKDPDSESWVIKWTLMPNIS